MVALFNARWALHMASRQAFIDWTQEHLGAVYSATAQSSTDVPYPLNGQAQALLDTIRSEHGVSADLIMRGMDIVQNEAVDHFNHDGLGGDGRPRTPPFIHPDTPPIYPDNWVTHVDPPVDYTVQIPIIVEAITAVDHADTPLTSDVGTQTDPVIVTSVTASENLDMGAAHTV